LLPNSITKKRPEGVGSSKINAKEGRIHWPLWQEDRAGVCASLEGGESRGLGRNSIMKIEGRMPARNKRISSKKIKGGEKGSRLRADSQLNGTHKAWTNTRRSTDRIIKHKRQIEGKKSK